MYDIFFSTVLWHDSKTSQLSWRLKRYTSTRRDWSGVPGRNTDEPLLHISSLWTSSETRTPRDFGLSVLVDGAIYLIKVQQHSVQEPVSNTYYYYVWLLIQIVCIEKFNSVSPKPYICLHTLRHCPPVLNSARLVGHILQRRSCYEENSALRH